MTSAKLAVWLKREGDAVDEGEAIAEVETDKASVEIPAPTSGILTRIVIPAGTDNLQAGDLLAVIGARDSSDPPTLPESPPTPMPAVEEPTPVRHDALFARTEPAGADTVPATPLARRMAAIVGLDLRVIERDPGVRLGKADVEREIARRGSPRLPPGSASAPFREVPLSPMRRVTAARLRQSKQEVPHFYLQADCVVDRLMELRARLNAARDGTALTVTDFFIRAAALALRKVPEANASWTDAGVRVYERADIAVAVSTPHGLITPVIREADRKGLESISREMKSLSERARAGQLQPAEYGTGTFTISNLGMYGITSLYPIINPPQSCILGVGTVESRPVAVDGRVSVGRVVSCTLAGDHRALDGVDGARFLAALRGYLEDPFSMILAG